MDAMGNNDIVNLPCLTHTHPEIKPYDQGL